MSLLRGSDTVELKLTVPAAQQRDAIRALGLDALDAQIRQVIFFDTPDLALDRAGVVVRARRIQGRVGDSVIKLRPLDPDDVSKDVRRLSGFGVEVDAIPGGFVCSGRLKCEADSDAIRQVVLGERPLRKLYTKEQRALFRAHAPDGIELDDLAVLGPIFVLKLKWQPRGFARKMVAEMWLYPDGARIFELSTKCLPSRGVPGRGRGAGLPRRARDRPLRRAADQDTHRARVLRRRAGGRLSRWPRPEAGEAPPRRARPSEGDRGAPGRGARRARVGAAGGARRVGDARSPSGPGRHPREAERDARARAGADPARADDRLAVHVLPRDRGDHGVRSVAQPDDGVAGAVLRRCAPVELRPVRGAGSPSGVRSQRLRRDAAGAV